MSTPYELVYRSRRREGVSDAELVERIFLPAIRRTHATKVSGCLWFDRFRFLGVLEGDEVAVRQEFQGICGEFHHHEVELIAAGNMPFNLFSRWGIRAVDTHPGETLARFESEFSDRTELGATWKDLPRLVTILRERLPFPSDLLAPQPG